MAFIDANAKEPVIEPICRELATAPSSYHEHAGHLADPDRRSARARRDDEIEKQIRRVHDACFGLYKAEGIWRQRSWPSASAVEMATLCWVDWLNNLRLVGPTGHIPPVEAEANCYAVNEILDMVA